MPDERELQEIPLDAGAGEGTGASPAPAEEEVPSPRRPATALLSAVSSISFLLFGYDTGIVSGAMLKISREYALTPWEHELVVSATIALAIVGSVAGGRLTGKVGRRPVIYVAALVFTAGALIMALSPSGRSHRRAGLQCLLFGRMVVGLAIGLSTASVPMYVAEACLPEERGRLVTSNALTIPVGQLLACILAAVLADAPGGWRWMLGLGGVPSALQLVAFAFLPESPRWLLSKGRTVEAAEALGHLRGLPATDHAVAAELRAAGAEGDAELDAAACEHGVVSPGAVSTAGAARTPPEPVRCCFLLRCRSAVFKRAAIVGGGLQLLQQLIGINTVMYYSATILQMGGLGSDSTAIWGATAVAATNAIGAAVGVRLVESSGRRPLVLTSLVVVVCSLLVLALAFRMQRAQVVPPALAGTVTLIALVLYIAGFSPGMGTMPWTINSEIYAQEDRSLGTSLASALNWTGNLVISLTFLSICEALTESGAFSVYALVGAAGWVFLYWSLPETKGKSLEEVVALFESDYRPTHAPCASCCPQRTVGKYVEFMREGEGDVHERSTTRHGVPTVGATWREMELSRAEDVSPAPNTMSVAPAGAAALPEQK